MRPRGPRFQPFTAWLGRLLWSAFVLVSTVAAAQGPLIPGSADDKAPTVAAVDPYGRETPRAMATGLVGAFASGNYERAANFLEPSGDPKLGTPQTRAAVARRLQQQLDHSGALLPFAALSNEAGGVLDDDLPLDQERIGSFASKSGKHDVIARRVSTEGAPPYWVVSATTLGAVAEQPAGVSGSSLTALLPSWLGDMRLAGAPLADWLVLFVIAVVAFVGTRLVFALLLKALRVFVREPDAHRGYQFAEAAFPPLSLYFAVIALFFATQDMQLAIVARQVVGRYSTIVGWVAFVWFLWRLIDMMADLWSARMARSDRRRAMSALVFVRRSAKSLLAIVAFVAVLDTVGIDVTTGIAALGLGGLAFALGAQKTVENLVGSLTVIIDQPVRVGDFCKVGEVVGTVEDIGMRSTRVRTNARTVVTIPNGNFASQQIENFSRRDRFLFAPVIGVTYDVDASQMRAVLESIRKVLGDDANVIEGARTRFVGFNASSLDIEVFAYIRTFDYAEFLGMREAVLLKIMDAVAAAGASIAFPTQTVVLKQQ